MVRAIRKIIAASDSPWSVWTPSGFFLFLMNSRTEMPGMTATRGFRFSADLIGLRFAIGYSDARHNLAVQRYLSRLAAGFCTRLDLVICHLSLVICHLSFVLSHLILASDK